MKYIAFCDVLGFSKEVSNDFEATIKVYQEFREQIHKWPFAGEITISIYSDSILIAGGNLPYILKAVKELHWVAQKQGWLIRGGIAYGKHWHEGDRQNLFIVSEALNKAVAIEKTISFPIVGISKDIILGIEAWVPRFLDGIFSAPLLFYHELTFVNPFNPYWFESSKIHTKRLMEKYPEHKNKHEWFLSLINAIEQDEILVPESILLQMLELGIIKDSGRHN